MRNLINFIFKNIHWLFFVSLVFLSALFLFNNNNYQRSKYLAFASELVGSSYAITHSFNSYIGLQETNQKLIDYIVDQEAVIQMLKEQLEEFSIKDRVPSFTIDSTKNAIPYEFIAARVVNNNISGTENLITLNRGSSDGVKADMGVLSLDGIVGIIINVSPNYSVAIPILNAKFRLSAKVSGSNYFGSLVWTERDSRYATLEDLPRHVEFEIGDTVVTSGYSAIFPEGVPVGLIVNSEAHRNNDFNSMKIKLFTNFSILKDVFIVKKNNKEEQIELESILK